MAAFFYLRDVPFPILLTHIAIVIMLYYVLRISLILMTVYFIGLWRKKIKPERTRFSESGHAEKRILIAGDSTAVGTGANDIAGTFTSMFAKDFPNTNISNVATNGALTQDILKQFKGIKYLEQDIIIISTGGNDIWSLITMKTLREDLTSVLNLAKMMSGEHVFILFFGNISSIYLLPYFARKLLTRRERKILQIFKDVCEQEGVKLLELFTNEQDNPFIENPKRYFSADRLHPSADGYALWYEHILTALKKNKYLS